MGYLRGIIDGFFREKDEKTSLFFPHGIFGSGYIISKDDEKNIKRFLRKYYVIFFLICFSIIFFFNSYLEVLFLFLFLLIIPLDLLIMHRLVKNKEKSTERLTIKEDIKITARSMGRIVSFLLFLLSLLFVSWLGFLVFRFGENKFLDLFIILFFGASAVYCGIVFIYSLKYRELK